MLVIAWILSVIVAVFAGYYFRGVKNKIVELEEIVKTKVDKKLPEPEPKSNLIDPYDVVQTAQYEHSQLMEKLNGPR